MSKSNFKIKHFDDYHSIYSDTYKTVELGCFPVEEFGYSRYFGLFYKGRKPSLKKILSSLKKKVCYESINHYITEYYIGITLEELEEEVRLAIKKAR